MLQIQRLQSASDEDVVLRNDDWQFQRLVEHLDHALLHGLVLNLNYDPQTTSHIHYLVNNRDVFLSG